MNYARTWKQEQRRQRETITIRMVIFSVVAAISIGSVLAVVVFYW